MKEQQGEVSGDASATNNWIVAHIVSYAIDQSAEAV